MSFEIQVLKMGECQVAGPEVYWMSHWNDWVTLYFWMVLIRGRGVTAIINTGPPEDLTDLNTQWTCAYGERGALKRNESERPLNALGGLGIKPEDVTHALITPLQSYATANIQRFTNAQVCVSKRGWIEDFHAEKFPIHAPRWGRIPRETLQYLMFDGWEKVRLLEDEDEIVPGVRAFWAGVHHRSSTCYVIDTARGRVAVSDCVFKYKNLEEMTPLGIQESMEEFYRTCGRIKRESDIFIPLYEPEVWRRYPGGKVA